MAEPTPRPDVEVDRIRQRYAARDASEDLRRYSLLSPSSRFAFFERNDLLARFLAARHGYDLSHLRALEVGCGNGINLAMLIALGATPEHLYGNELLEPRLELARSTLPAQVKLLPGNCLELPIEPGSLDVVLQFTVFSSILDDALCAAIAERMWTFLRPGGAVVSYDLRVANPRNPDVRPVTVRDLRRYFPRAAVSSRSCTLAPPIARRVAPISESLHRLLSAIPILRSHAMTFVEKPRE